MKNNDAQHEVPMDELRIEQDAFISLLPKMLDEHPGQFTVFHAGEPAGFFRTYDEAYGFALKTFGLDTPFLVSQVIPPDTAPASLSWYAGVMFG